MKKLKNKGAGPDGVPMWYLKHAVNYLLGSLASFYCATIRLGYIPMVLKTAVITPMAKSKNSDVPNKFRPISVTSVISSMLEKSHKSTFIQHCLVQLIMHT